MKTSLVWIVLALVWLAAAAHAAETADPIRATVQVRYGSSAGSGTAISPTVVLTCAHIHAGEAGGMPFVIAKHWSDGTDEFHGYLIASHAELDLALVWVPQAQFDHVELVAADPATPQAATFYGHARAKPEILSFRGFISRGFTTNFDIVAGHDSIEGQSGGGVFNAEGDLLGVMHGRPNATATTRGGGIFTPARHIRQWIATDCRGPNCRPLLPHSLYGNPSVPQGQVTPPPPRQPLPSAPLQKPILDEPHATPIDLQPLLARLEELSARMEQLATQPGPPGPPGPKGDKGDSGESAATDHESLSRQLEARLLPIIDQRIEEAVARRVPHYFSIVPRNAKGN